MKSKIILITGATGGIGKAAAIELAKGGAHLIIHGRDEEKTKHVQQEIIRVTGNTQVDIVTADLFLAADTKAMVAEIKSRFPVVDILINNAGVMMNKNRENTSEGTEKTIALNLIAPFLLMTGLLPCLIKSDKGRIINVSSSAHRQNAEPNFNNISEDDYSPMKAYGNAKLYLILISQRLSALLKENGVDSITVNSMHPGAVATNFSTQSDLGWLFNFLGKIARRFFRTPEQGADTLVYLATSSDIKGVTGKYFIDRKTAEVNPKYDNVANEKVVWNWLEEYTGSAFSMDNL
ncbi:SDR family oxidoreductase [Pedobacter zeae]|nr:SDR family oxidoreductase [Pedobacter zeae]MBB4109088.1 NAD(P)-dependent dehydrogenase (short-subunit alcohol dehydrogenase family) [Pedobacter zeae]